MTDRIESHGNGGMSFVGPNAVEVYAATVIAGGLRMYARCGMIPNRGYTPTAMMRRAAQITGRKFKARDYLGAADALKEWATAQAAAIHALSNAADHAKAQPLGPPLTDGGPGDQRVK